VGLSLSLLFGTFLGAVWVSSRIYRIGILSYGKKPSLKELIRWMRYA
jgi:ABC-2 type transport system permease protein